jgi:hypothetical protein
MIINNKIDKFTNITVLKNLHNSVNFRPNANIFIPACSGNKVHPMTSCSCVLSPEEEYHILWKFNNILFVHIRQDYCVRQVVNHTICFAYCNPLVIIIIKSICNVHMWLNYSAAQLLLGDLSTREQMWPCMTYICLWVYSRIN